MFDPALGDDRRREFVGVVDALATAASTVEIGYVRLTSEPANRRYQSTGVWLDREAGM
jgi:hypothetical protein